MLSRLGMTLVGTVLLLLAGCGGSYGVGTGGLRPGRPQGQMESVAGASICGVQLAAPWVMQPAVFDISGERTAGPVPLDTVDSVVLVRTSDGCDRGADITISPRAAMTIAKVAKAPDGRPVTNARAPTVSGRDGLAASRPAAA